MDLGPTLENVTPHLPEVAAFALLSFLAADADRLIPGVADISSRRLLEWRGGWAATDIVASFAGLTDVTVDSYAELLVVWPQVEALSRCAPTNATALARRLAKIDATFVAEVARRIAARMNEKSRAAFLAAYKDAGGRQRAARLPSAPTTDTMRDKMLELKTLEHVLRSQLAGATDIGRKPTQAERALVVRLLGLGYTMADLTQALHGQAIAAEQRPVWKGENAAEVFVRMTWVFSSTERFLRALAERPRPRGEKQSVIEGDDGRRFAAGAEIVVSRPMAHPVPIETPTYSDALLANLSALGVKTMET